MRALRRIAITGAEGVLGSVLRHRLCQQFEIIAISRMPLHLEHVVETRAVDLTDPAQVRDAFADADAVVHLAATDSTVTAPWAVVHGQNMQMDYNVYEECVRTKVQRYGATHTAARPAARPAARAPDSSSAAPQRQGGVRQQQPRAARPEHDHEPGDGG